MSFTKQKEGFQSAIPPSEVSKNTYEKALPEVFVELRQKLINRLEKEKDDLANRKQRIPLSFGLSCKQLAEEMGAMPAFRKKQGLETYETETGRRFISRNRWCFEKAPSYPYYTGLYCGHPDGSLPKKHNLKDLCGDHIQITKEASDRRTLFTVENIDAVGHGYDPASLMILARRFLDYKQSVNPDNPIEWMNHLDEYLSKLPLDDTNASEVSFLYAQIKQESDAPVKKLSFVRAGSGAILIISRDEQGFVLTRYASEPIGPQNSPVAGRPDSSTEEKGIAFALGVGLPITGVSPFEKEIPTGDAVIVSSDGIFDTTINFRGKETALGDVLNTIFEETCSEVLARNPSATQQEIGETLMKKLIGYHLEDGDPNDDVSMVLIPEANS